MLNLATSKSARIHIKKIKLFNATMNRIENLEDKQSASILAQFDESLQGEIAYRLAIMEKTSPELIQDIDDVLTEQLGGIFGGSLSKAGGTESVASIL